MSKPPSPQLQRRAGLRSRKAAVSQWCGRLRTAADTERLGMLLGRFCRGGEVLALYGELGTGKTTLVRGLAIGLGVLPGRVRSPSFVLVHEYTGRLPLAHADLYRLDSEDELQHVGLADYVDGVRVVAVEWAEKAVHQLPEDRLDIRLAHHTPSTRTVILTAAGPTATRLLAETLHGYARLKRRAKPVTRRARG